MKEIVVGTRSSKLAMRQTELVIKALVQAGVTTSFRIEKMKTEGDKKLNVPLAQLGKGGVFLETLQEKLLNKEIDMAVHSLKDIPTTLPKGLHLACIPLREDHRDAYIANNHTAFNELPKNAVIGTSSLRRSAQILAKRHDLRTKWIRGPIDSRVEQLRNGDYDAIILAAAGINRLGIQEGLVTEYLSDDQFVPAMGQGALAIECREDEEIKKMCSVIHDEETAQAVVTERLFLDAFEEGEQAPIGAYAFVTGGLIHLRGMVISLDGQTVLKSEASDEEPYIVAQKVANELKAQGALRLIREANKEIQKE